MVFLSANVIHNHFPYPVVRVEPPIYSPVNAGVGTLFFFKKKKLNHLDVSAAGIYMSLILLLVPLFSRYPFYILQLWKSNPNYKVLNDSKFINKKCE